MIFKKFQDIEISALGFGAMRLPVIDGNDSRIDLAALEKMLALAMEKGVNYYDTAWGYHAGESEKAMGAALSAYPRESFYLASKFPGYDLSNMDKVEEIFNKQLEKCRVDYFDFYLFHNVCEMNIDAYLDEKYGIFSYLSEQKKKGRIKRLGFSAHGNIDTIKRFLSAYGDSMEFCQIQLNYIDWDFQDARLKLELLSCLNIPVFVMEPLRGGSLAGFSSAEAVQLKKLRPEAGAAEWAFRFIQSVGSVVTTLSGMSDIKQLEENIKIFDSEKPLNENEIKALLALAKERTNQKTVPCTACRYCTSHCPAQLDIPELISLYNEHSFTGGGFLAPMRLSALADDKKPSACLACRSCEAVCPQNIKISEILADFNEKL